MSQRLLWIGLASVVVGAVLAWVLTAPRPPVRTGGGEAVVEIPTPTPAPEQRILLLFPGEDGLLHPELRSTPFPADVELKVRTVVRELLAGPGGEEGLAPLLPWPAELESAFLDGQGNAFVNLTAPPEPVAGSHTEITLSYGIVNSVLLNCPELHGVQLLFGGREVPTLSGHLDLSKPLVLNKRFIAAG